MARGLEKSSDRAGRRHRRRRSRAKSRQGLFRRQEASAVITKPKSVAVRCTPQKAAQLWALRLREALWLLGHRTVGGASISRRRYTVRAGY